MQSKNCYINSQLFNQLFINFVHDETPFRIDIRCIQRISSFVRFIFSTKNNYISQSTLHVTGPFTLGSICLSNVRKLFKVIL